MTLPLRFRRLAALAILAGLAAVPLWLTSCFLSNSRTAQQEAAERSIIALTGYRRQAEQRPLLERRLQELKARDVNMPGAISSPSATFAAANLQGEVKQIVEAHRGEIKSAQTLAPTMVEGFEKIQIRYTLVAPLSGVIEMIHVMESHTPYLFLDDIDLHGPENPSNGSAPTQEARLNIRWTVSVFRWSGQ